MFNILIVDDTKSVHAFLKALLAKCPEIQTTSVFDGREALNLLSQKSDFDLILLDWEMPNLNGPSTYGEIKDLGIQTPVIMMTTKNSVEDIGRMLTMGISEYMMKPFTIDILFEKMGTVSGKELHYAV